MGAHTFQETIGGKGMTASEAYTALVDQALYESGHDAYNGTISTTSGFVRIEPGRRRVRTVIREILEDEENQVRKWGPAGCIELKGAALTRWRKRNGLAGTRAKAYVFFGWAAS